MENSTQKKELSKAVEAETNKIRNGFMTEMLSPTQQLPEMNKLPETGLSNEEVLKLSNKYLNCGKYDWKGGAMSGTVYNGNDELTKLMTQVYGKAAWTNPLHPDAFPGVRKMEAEIIRMCCNLFNVS